MATLIQSLAMSGSRKNDGTPNAGGRIFLYSPGTQSAVDAYADRDESAIISLNNGGILLDATGRRQIYINQPVTITEEDADGTVIASYPGGSDITANVVELISPGFTGMGDDGIMQANRRTYVVAALASIFASCGGEDANFRGSAGLVDIPINQAIQGLGLTPQMFGAVGNGTADDTTAMNRWATAVWTTQIPGFLPAGTYSMASALTFPSGGLGAIINGAGKYSAIIKFINSASAGVTISGGQDFLSNFNIFASNAVVGSGLTVTGGVLRGVQVGSLFSINVTSGTPSIAYDSSLLSATTSTVGTWRLVNCQVSGATSGGTTVLAFP